MWKAGSTKQINTVLFNMLSSNKQKGTGDRLDDEPGGSLEKLNCAMQVAEISQPQIWHFKTCRPPVRKTGPLLIESVKS
jgi:hypothetical protein